MNKGNKLSAHKILLTIDKVIEKSSLEDDTSWNTFSISVWSLVVSKAEHGISLAKMWCYLMGL